MKILKSFVYGLIAAASMGGFTACQDNIDAPEFEVPVATLVPNTTIYDLKTEFWDDAQNYIKSIGTKENGDHYIISGRVITSDYAGNIFKSITIQDETAALTFSINSYNLYLNYRVGQEIVVDLTGLNIGKYNGLQQIGDPEWYEKGQAWEATFMSYDVFASHAQLNGLPDESKIIVHTLDAIPSAENPEELIKWQGQLVRINNVTLTPQTNDATGETLNTFGIYHENFNQLLNIPAGGTMYLRTSGYSNFYFNRVPTEAFDITGYLSYYGSSTTTPTPWQMMLIDYSGISNEGNPTMPTGSKTNPWEVGAAVDQINQGTTSAGWTKGYIVGTVAPEVTNITSAADIDFTSSPVLANTVVIGLTPESRDLSELMVIALPQGSVMRDYVAVKTNPDNLGKVLTVYGTPDKYLGTFAIVGNTGSASEFTLEGVEVPGSDVEIPDYFVTTIDENFDSQSIPSTWTNLQVEGTKAWYVASFANSSTGVTEYYAAMTGYKGTAPFDSWLITPAINIDQVDNKVLTFDSQNNNYSSTSTTFEVYVLTSPDPTACTPVKLDATFAAESNGSYSGWKSSGSIDLSSFTGYIYIGWRYKASVDPSTNYATWCLDNVKLNADGQAAVTPTVDYKGSFNTFNNSTAKATAGTYTNSTGWTASNCSILGGLDSGTDSNPRFAFIGSSSTLAPCLYGNSDAASTGKLTSPTLTGGCNTLSFSYGFPFSGTSFSFTVNVLQNGNVVKTETIAPTTFERKVAYEHTINVGVTGSFSIEIVNNAPGWTSANTNACRVAIWNLTWE
jgi:hypothetical protein